MIILKDDKILYKDIQKNGYNFSTFAQKIGVTRATVSQIVRHVRNPSAKTAVKICEVLDANFEKYFFIESVHKQTTNTSNS